MANYTMTIAEMMNYSLTSHIFPKEYDFYLDDEDAKKAFEDKFIKHYYYREIGFETPFMFMQKLESHLLLNMPYWKQLYQTELESRDINFLLNKDLRETFMREINTENTTTGTNNSQQNSTSTNTVSQSGTSSGTNTVSQSETSSGTNTASQSGTSSGTNTSTQNDTTSNTHKESSIQDGVAVSSLSEGYLTASSSDTGSNETTLSSESTGENKSTLSSETTGENKSTLSSETTGENKSNGTSSVTDDVETSGTTTQSGNEKMIEKTDLLSQGNIGITSSAQLLKEWRDVLINMDKIIIDSCNDLFLKLY